MKQIAQILCVVGVLQQGIMAQAADVNGVVQTAAGVPVSGSVVYLSSNANLSVTTGPTGEFNVGSNTAILSGRVSKSASLRMTIDGGDIGLLSANPLQNVLASFFTLDGRCLARRAFATLPSGVSHITIPPHASGMLIARISVNGQVQTRCIGMGGGWTDFSTGSQSLHTALVTSSIIDTLCVFANGFIHARIPLDSGVKNDMVVVLDTSESWEPSGTVEHLGSMVKIAAAGYSFEMGQPLTWLSGDSSLTFELERPVHTVSFTRDFFMDTTEVTQELFDSIMKNYSDYSTPANWVANYGVGATHPAYYLFWEDAVLFCNARSKAEGLDSVYAWTSIEGTPGSGAFINGLVSDLTKNGYRLPTEAEWEYACRGGTTTDFWWGRNLFENGVRFGSTALDSALFDSLNINGRVAHEGLTLGDPAFGTQPVASKPANPYGLYDMTGNVSEWCHDFFGEYAAADVVDPSGPLTGLGHADRGGNWGDTDPLWMRSSCRYFYAPDYDFYFQGFRTVRNAQ